MQGEGADPVEEVLADAALLPQGVHILVGGRHNPHVHGAGLGGAHGADFPLLQRPEERHLGGQGNGANFIQEEGAPLGGNKKAVLVPDGPSECPFDIAKQLALQKIFGEGGAVDGDEGLARPAPRLVDGLGHKLLASAALPQDEHRHVRAGHLLNLVVKPLHGGRFPHHQPKMTANILLFPSLCFPLLPCSPALALPPRLHRLLKRRQHPLRPDGGGKPPQRHPPLHQLLCPGNLVIRGQENHRRALGRGRGGKGLGEPDVAEDGIPIPRRQLLPGLLRTEQGAHPTLLVPQKAAENLPAALVGLQEQNPGPQRPAPYGLARFFRHRQ